MTMEAFQSHSGLVIPFNRANIDTDAMLPKQYLKSILKTGYGDWLFDGLRYLDEGDVNTGHLDTKNKPRVCFKPSPLLGR
jgi:3-isopropylmalate/(R)-2-methylmalate dehydratase small subunit